MHRTQGFWKLLRFDLCCIQAIQAVVSMSSETTTSDLITFSFHSLQHLENIGLLILRKLRHQGTVHSTLKHDRPSNLGYLKTKYQISKENLSAKPQMK